MTPTVIDDPQIETSAQARRTFADVFSVLALDQLIESGHNPRRHFDDRKLQELADSIREKGIVEPLVVREIDNGQFGEANSQFEIIAGARRYRAARAAGLSHVPCVVRAYSDEDVLELFIIENCQRDDLAPLEQARGFKALLDANADKYSAASIATKVGMSAGWVWDRLKLLDLIPEASSLLEQGRISAAHAIVIARLKTEDQRRVVRPRGGSIHDGEGGLWTHGEADHLVFESALAEEKDPYAGLKPKTVRELDTWINDHVRFDVAHAAKAQPLQFAEVAERVEVAQAQPGRGRKVIAITFEGYVQPEAKSGEERTFGPRSFRFADGQDHPIDGSGRKSRLAARCDHAVLGVVVAGTQRGQAFEVCIARDKCQVHWKAEIAEKAKSDKLRESGKSKQADARDKKQAARQESSWERENRERTQREDAWLAIQPAVFDEAIAQVKGVTALTAKHAAGLGKVRCDLRFDLLTQHLGAKWFKSLPASLLLSAVCSFSFRAWGSTDSGFRQFMRDVATPLGLNLKRLQAIHDKHQPPSEPAVKAKTGSSQKKTRAAAGKKR